MYEQQIKQLPLGWVAGIKGWLAGGALTSVFSGKPINDLDIYFRSEEDFLDACEEMYGNGMWCVDFSQRSITFADGSTVVQLMHFNYFNSPEEIFEKFDFTVCMAALNLETKEFYSHPNFLTDLARRELVFNEGTAFPIASGLRVKKYQDRGYTINQGEQLRILLACAALRMETWDDLRLQLGGHYGEELKLQDNGEFTPAKAITAFDRERPYIKVEKEVPASMWQVKLLLKGGKLAQLSHYDDFDSHAEFDKWFAEEGSKA